MVHPSANQPASCVASPESADAALVLLDRVAGFVRGPDFDPPPLPRIAEEVWSACAMGGASALQVAHIVHRDPVIAGRLMQLANAARFGPSGREVESLRDAIVRIGFDEVLNAVLVFSLRGALYTLPTLSTLGERSRRHGVATGLAASILADATGRAASARAFLAGLLHDVGEPIVLHAIERVCRPDERARCGGEEAAVEAARVLHGAVGALVADRWHLDLELRVVVAKHHGARPLADNGPLLQLVRLADLVACAACESLEGQTNVALPADLAGFPLSLIEHVRSQLPTRLAEYDDA